MPKLTQDHFSIDEMTESSIATRLGIDNTPDLLALGRLSKTVTHLEKVRAVLGHPVHVNSGYRSEALERVLKEPDFNRWCLQQARNKDGDAWKEFAVECAHMQGYAADFTCAQFGTPEAVVRAILGSRIRFDKCILEGKWVHISFDPRFRRMTFQKVFDASGLSTTAPLVLDDSNFPPVDEVSGFG